MTGDPERRRGTIRKVDVLLLLASACLVLILVTAAFVYRGFEGIVQRTAASAWRTPERMQINEAVARLILAGRASEVYAFYAFEVGDPVRSALYVQAAIEGDGKVPAPIDFVMSVGWWEGGHQLEKVDGPNENGSYDVRPMGLNSYTYKRYSISDLQRVEVNIPFGVVHLVGDFQKWGSWENALVAYNTGGMKNVGADQVTYVVRVLRHEWELDRRFAARFPEMF